jgi:CRISPR-associated endonuclease/helicase Cas3
MENWRLFWAKTNREKVEGLPEDWTHPLWAHLIDVGSAAQTLWDEFLPRSLKHKMAAALGMNETDAGKFLSIWIGLHDLGKGIPSFQEMNEPAKQRLIGAGLDFHPNLNRLHHGHASIAIAHNWLGRKAFENRGLLHALAAFVGIHHGKLVQSKVWEDVADSKRPEGALGDAAWKQAQYDLTEVVFTAWGSELPPAGQFPTLKALRDPWPDWLMAFAGWATLADWLGSMQTCYDHTVQATDDLRAYIANSREGAIKAYKTAGLDQQANLRHLPFSEHFGNDPRPLQQIAAKLPLDSDQPNLVIVEAPTGEGKTEAGFYLTALHGGGVYVAMPSQSTSDGLFPRLKSFIAGSADENLKAAHVGDTAALRLVHGNDLLHDDAVSLLTIAEATARMDDNDGDKKNPNASGERMLGWFMPKKRALLVPYGVGTVDQLFLGVLYAKHFFLRLFALCGKTVIFDEVHAYDAYMNTIFGQLLRWLRALDVNVVVLSATLPSEARQRMLEAWGSTNEPDTTGQPAPYPVVWHAAAGVATAHPFAPAEGRGQRLTFRWCGADIDTVVQTARQLLAEGATVMVVCNTVKRAQEVFRELDSDDVLPEADRMLLHARMPQAWRQKREKTARARFGKDRCNRPGLLVGTQVIEQSLDLDVDAQITDLAPVDLLLQRAGRLHRHQRQRPNGFTDPVLYIACADADAGHLPDVGEISGGGKIYETALLWKTWATLQQLGGWNLPLGDASGPGYRALIEAVYGDVPTAPAGLAADVQEQYIAAVAKWQKEDIRQMADATARLVPLPKKLRALFTFDKPELAEEDEDGPGQLPEQLRALTRNPNGINAEVLLLNRTPKGWSIEPDGDTVLYRPKHKKLHPNTLRTLFGAAVRISNAGIVSALWKLENPEWSALQEEHRVLKRFHLIELTEASAEVGNTRLTLNNRLGLLYEELSQNYP